MTLTVDEIVKLCNCAECPFAKDGRPPHKPVLFEANTREPIAILIGEGPGENEVREGRPFVGATGKELDSQLAKAGIPRHRCIVGNATACRPPSGKTDQMLGRATKCCKPLFDAQIKQYREDVRPEGIQLRPTLAMGKWAAQAVLGKAQATETGRGFIRDGNVITTWHPTYAFFRNPWVKGDFLIDLERFKRLIDGKLQASPTIITNPTISDLHLLLQAIKRNDSYAAVDIETGPEDGDHEGFTGKDPTRATLKTIAIGTDDFACAFTWPILNGMWVIVSAILLDPNIIKVLHNGEWFDKRVLQRYGVHVEPTIDTREIRRALVATSGLSLRYLAQTYVDFTPWKENEDDK